MAVMAYDEGLAERLRNLLDGQPGLTEKKMFGGLAFLLDGKMCCGIVKDELLVRVSPENYTQAVKQPHAGPMDFTGRVMKGFVMVAQEGIDRESDLEAWVEPSIVFVRTLLLEANKKKPATKRRRR